MSGILRPLDVEERGGKLFVNLDPAKVFSENEKQALAYRAAMSGNYREMLYGGGTGGGKTVVACYIAARKALEIPGCNVIMVRDTIGHVRDQLFAELLKILPKELIKSVRFVPTPKIELITGSNILGLPGENPEDFKGWNDTYVVIVDEADQCNPKIFPIIFTRFRVPKGSSAKVLLFLTCNPADGFLYEKFIKNRDKSPPTTVFIPALAKDNRYLEDGYIEMLGDQLTRDEYAQLVEGKWGGLSGQVYSQFVKDVGPWGAHVCEPFSEEHVLDPERIYEHVQGMDYATRNVTAINFLAKDVRTGHVFVYDEIWGKGMSLIEIAKKYKEKCEEHGLEPEERFIQADHNMWTDVDGFSPAASLMYGVSGHGRDPSLSMPLSKADKNSQRYSTASILLDYRKLSILTRCPMLIDSMSVLRHKKETPSEERFELKAEGIAPKGKDSVDALGYGLNKIVPPGSEITASEWEPTSHIAPPRESGAYGKQMKRRAEREAIARQLENNGFAGKRIELVQGEKW